MIQLRSSAGPEDLKKNLMWLKNHNSMFSLPLRSSCKPSTSVASDFNKPEHTFMMWFPPHSSLFHNEVILKCKTFLSLPMLTSNVSFFLHFSHASAFWLRSQREEQTQVHGAVPVSASWHDRHGGSGECVSSLETSFSITMFSWRKCLEMKMLLSCRFFFLAQNGPSGKWQHRKHEGFTLSRDWVL